MAEEEVNFIERWVIQMGITKVFGVIDGYKTYIIAGIGVLVALAGHFWGPFNLAGGVVPKESWNDVWTAVQASGIVATLRHAVQKSQDAAATPPTGGTK